MQPYTTLAGEAGGEFTQRRSRFIGTAAPVSTEEEAVAFLGRVKARYKEANHQVYAYCLRRGQQSRFSDDGEPQGTAGKPVLEVLQREGLTDVAVVVTRYFGGVLLGTGGLVHAYTQGAKLAVEAATLRHLSPAARVELAVSYDLYGKLTYLLPDYRAAVVATDFGQEIRLVLWLQAQQLEPFSARLRELSGGLVQPCLLEENYYCFSEK